MRPGLKVAMFAGEVAAPADINLEDIDCGSKKRKESGFFKSFGKRGNRNRFAILGSIWKMNFTSPSF
jgi:hypothetical protein